MAERTQKTMVEVRNFRLMLSDSSVEGGQRVKTFQLGRGEADAITMQSLLEMLREHFDFAQLTKTYFGAYAKQNKVPPEMLHKADWLMSTSVMSMMGIDGSRHAPIRNDEQLVMFFKTVRNTQLPSIEVKLTPTQLQRLSSAESGQARSLKKAEADRVAELEDLNYKMSKATEKVQKQIDSVLKRASNDKDDLERLVNTVKIELSSAIQSNHKDVKKDVKKLYEADEGQVNEIAELKKVVEALTKNTSDSHDKLASELNDLNVKMSQKFADVSDEMEKMKYTDSQLAKMDQSQQQQLNALEQEIKRVDEAKVDIKDWTSAEEEMSTKIDEEITEIKKTISQTEKDLSEMIKKQREELLSADKVISAKIEETIVHTEGEIKRLEMDVQRQVGGLTETVVETKADLEAKVESQFGGLSTSCDKRFNELTNIVKTNDREIKQSLTNLEAKADNTFQKFADRLDNLVKAERSRLGNIERDLVELTAKLRSDCRLQVEQVRVDYEQEAARLDGDLADLHMKHDVVKQEISFFQSRLLEQRDWAQRQLAETMTATRAAQVDAQEGVAAATKMAHALRDDQVGFRDKMAKHISLLQHASDSYGDAINTLETQRVRMRMELDAILDDHKAYVTDMDGWADDVRVKVERLFKAMEPPRCEWIITRAKERMKDMKKPLTLNSQNFALQGLKDAQLQFYPSGTNQSPEGKAVLRLVLPPSAHVRYQCYLGKMTEGSREFRGGGSLHVDLLFDSWRDQINDDGSLKIVLEVLEDLTNVDASLARAIHLEYEAPAR